MDECNLRNKPEGFTLIEVMIALLIFAIGMLAIGTMHISAIRGDETARSFTEASNFAMNRLERFMVTNYDNITSASEVLDNKFTVTWTVTDDDPITNNKRVNMTVIWHDQGTNRTLTMQQIFARPNN